MLYNRFTVGQVIGRLRNEKGLSQEALSALAGISRSHLTLIENGYKTLRLDTLWHIAEALDVRPSTLIRITEEQDEQSDMLQ